MNIHTNWTAPLAFALLALNTVVIPAQAGVDKVTPAITVKAEAFAPQDVKLLDGPFKHALDLDVKWLLRLEPDRLLSRYRSESGLEPKAKSYDGWEGMTIAGHSLGHYLSAIARMYQNTGDAEFKRRVDYIVDELAICQQTNGNGFVGGMPNSKRVFAEVARGEIRSAGFDLNGSWVPWYNLHKLFEGLLDARRFCDNAKALEVAAKLGDFSIEVTKNLTEEQWQKMLACEHGGMNEALADLYAMTGETKYLDLAKKFYHQAILEPLAAGHDELSGKHANTQIPKIIGAARLFELTGDAKFGSIARNFYNIVLTNHTYVTGGNSEGEYFGPSGKLNDRIKGNTTETCNTYNMLKLNRELFSVEPSAKLADYYERALWNHILASQNPEDGRVLYFLTLKQGVQKQFMGEYDFTCCSGTGMENSARFSENIYMHGGNALWVNQFIASELNWAEKGLRIRQETDFPNKAATTLKISATQPVAVALQIRHPFWATNGFVIKVNGEKVSGPSIASSYTAIAREWKSGDTVEVEMPFNLRTETMPDNPKRVAIFYGPILLAGDIGEPNSTGPVPVLLTGDQPVAKWLKPVAGKPLTFRTADIGRPNDVELKPFFATYAHRHTVYWDVFSEADWAARQKEYEAARERAKRLEARTVDFFQPGEMQPERDHNVQGEKTSPGEWSGRKLRHATDGGWFSFDVKVPADGAAELIMTYWGSESGKRTFDVLVDGTKIDTTSLGQVKPNEFYDKTYPLPAELLKGKSKVTVKLAAHLGNFAGGVFGVRVVRSAPGTAKVTVQVDQPGAKINPAMWGVFFEDINFGADGGLYAELVKNRGFEFPDAMMGWKQLALSAAGGQLEVRTENPFNAANAHYLRVNSLGSAFGVANEGFRGIGVKAGEDYDFTAQVRSVSGEANLRVELVSADGVVLAKERIKKLPTTWKKLSATLRPKATEAKARLNVIVEGKGTVDIDFVSLFPRKTWKNRPGGLRADMVQALADMKPGFMRFPGGCIVEGTNLANRYQWKTTIGPVEERKLIKNRWNVEFKHRLTPDYFQSFGLGFFEYFQLCEDIGAEPLPILNCGMACQFNTGELCPLDQLDVYIQDALDLIEFANGPATSTWGAKRAAMGHPAPFRMKMMGVGNEQWGPQYVERFAAFAKAIKAKHPEIQLIGATGPSPADDRFKFLSAKLRELKADILDEHCYDKPAWFFNAATRYDKYDRNSSKIFMGEYAAQSDKVVSVNNRNTLECAIAEAAFMTGLERNADVVRMASYAPLFAHVDAWQWCPDMIWTDNLRVLRTANYHVQSLYARNRGDVALPVRLEAEGVGDAAEPKLFSSATRDEKTGEVIIKLVNAADKPVTATLDLRGAGKGKQRGVMSVLTSVHWMDANTFEQPELVAPRESALNLTDAKSGLELPARSFTVLRVKAN